MPLQPINSTKLQAGHKKPDMREIQCQGLYHSGTHKHKLQT